MRAFVVLLVLLATTGRARADDGSGSDAAAKPVVVAAADSDKAAVPVTTTSTCIDQDIADRLAVKRKRRGAVDRLFVKQHRHEITIGGGYLASDLLSGTYLVSASYTYHMTDETAVEFGGAFTHANADLIRSIEDNRGVVLTDTFADEWIGESLLVWSPVYGKLRLGGSIVHFDLHGDAGVGVIATDTSRGAAGVVGFGVRLFMGQAFAFRIDARDRIFRQELLDEQFLVNDTAITASISMFVPFHN
jgi:outer membrane beta-barrel protein